MSGSDIGPDIRHKYEFIYVCISIFYAGKQTIASQKKFHSEEKTSAINLCSNIGYQLSNLVFFLQRVNS